MDRNHFLSRRAVLTALGASALVTAAFATGPNDPLPRGSKVLQQGKALVTANGQAAHVFVPKPTVLMVDYIVEAGKELKMIVITDAQFQQVSAGRKITGQAVHSSLIKGVDSTAVSLGRGTFVLFFGINQSGDSQLTYRAHCQCS